MSFDTLTPRMKQVAESALRLCVDRHGRTGLKTEEEIHRDISWKPSFFVKNGRYDIVAAEVFDELYPQVLKIAAHDIRLFDVPISVYVAVPLEVYMADHKQVQVRLLKRHGFGIVTVDDGGLAVVQCSAIPLAQHISEEDLEAAIRELGKKLKAKFRQAHATYVTNVGQGLQGASQIVEAMIKGVASAATKAGWGNGLERNTAADTIDALYALGQLRNERAALGAARNFVREYRNVASHAPNSAKQAAEKIRKCRTGFFEAVRVTGEIEGIARRNGFRLSIHTT